MAKAKASLRKEHAAGRRRPWLTAGMLLILVGLAIGFVLWSRGEVTSSRQGARAALAEQWLTAIAQNDMPTALARAEDLCRAVRSPMVDPDYVALAEREGIPREFLSGSFNAWDYQLWSHSYFIDRLSDQLSGQPDDVRALFAAVSERISPAEDANSFAEQSPWPYWVWKLGVGVCDRQAWLLCELAYQHGWETQVVYLVDPQIKDSPHSLCELRKGDKVWLADSYKRVLLEGTAIDDVVENPELMKKTWPSEQIQRGFQSCILWTPSYAQSYCPRNQVLQGILNGFLKGRCPRFAEDPKQRLDTYRRLRAATERKLHFRMRLWDYPFRLLKEEMDRRTASQASG